MAVSFFCKCAERKKPVAERKWLVSQRQCHHSAFAGYHYTYSEYSTVHCLSCRACGRSKANYVMYLRDGVLNPDGWAFATTVEPSIKT